MSPRAAYIPSFELGVRRYRDGRYWHAHEAWEEVWLAESGAAGSMLKALIQLSAALLHAGGGNLASTDRILGRVDRYLDGLPPVLYGFDTRRLREEVGLFRRDVRRVLAGEKSRLNWRLKPRIEPAGMSLPRRRCRPREGPGGRPLE